MGWDELFRFIGKIILMHDYSYREDQALLVLQCNGYNFTSAVADICQYRPKIGLFEMDVVATAEKISRIMINIRKSSLKRKRCFKQIHSKVAFILYWIKFISFPHPDTSHIDKSSSRIIPWVTYCTSTCPISWRSSAGWLSTRSSTRNSPRFHQRKSSTK